MTHNFCQPISFLFRCEFVALKKNLFERNFQEVPKHETVADLCCNDIGDNFYGTYERTIETNTKRNRYFIVEKMCNIKLPLATQDPNKQQQQEQKKTEILHNKQHLKQQARNNCVRKFPIDTCRVYNRVLRKNGFSVMQFIYLHIA